MKPTKINNHKCKRKLSKNQITYKRPRPMKSPSIFVDRISVALRNHKLSLQFCKSNEWMKVVIDLYTGKICERKLLGNDKRFWETTRIWRSQKLQIYKRFFYSIKKTGVVNCIEQRNQWEVIECSYETWFCFDLGGLKKGRKLEKGGNWSLEAKG